MLIRSRNIIFTLKKNKMSFGPAKSTEYRNKSIERKNDQFYTTQDVANKCVDIVLEYVRLKDISVWIEPAAGTGSFVKAVKKQSNKKIYKIDIDKNSDAKHMDFLLWELPRKVNGLVVCIGNPPFGKNSSLAVKFINHAAQFSDVIAFILPLTFSKPTYINKLDTSLHLVHFEKLPKDSFEYKGKTKNVSCGLYIFVKDEEERRKSISKGPSESTLVQFVNPKDANMSVQRVGTSAGNVIFSKRYIMEKAESKNYYKIYIDKRLLNKKQRDKLDYMDFKNAAIKQNVSGMPSISKSEVVKLIHDFLKVEL